MYFFLCFNFSEKLLKLEDMPSQLGLAVCPHLGTASTPKLISLCLENRACPVHALYDAFPSPYRQTKGTKLHLLVLLFCCHQFRKQTEGRAAKCLPWLIGARVNNKIEAITQASSIWTRSLTQILGLWKIRSETKIYFSFLFCFSLPAQTRGIFQLISPLMRNSNYFSLNSQRPSRPLDVLISELGHL